MPDMSTRPFLDYIQKACQKKAALLSESLGRYAARSIYAGAFLTASTAAGAYAAIRISDLHPNLGKFFFAFIFAFGLAYILFLNAELATSNMMYLSAGVYSKAIQWRTALKILLLCSFFNLIGALLAGFFFGHTDAFSHLTPDSFLVTMVEAKLARTGTQIFLEAIVANFLVNIAILSFIMVKDQGTKLSLVLSAIFMFVFMGNEHVVANFASFSILLMSPFKETQGLEFWNILRQWSFAYLGNLVGGGLLIGVCYAWLNQTKTVYHEHF